MVDAIVICRDLSQLLLTPSPHNKAVPLLEELSRTLWNIHVLHGSAHLDTMLPINDPEAPVLNFLEGSGFFLRLWHYAQRLPS